MSDNLRGFYKNFLENEAGIDFIKWIIAVETNTQLEGYRATSMEAKALAMAKLNALYDVRTHLIEMSNPPVKQSKKSTGG